jgi:hypothetical protein
MALGQSMRASAGELCLYFLYQENKKKKKKVLRGLGRRWPMVCPCVRLRGSFDLRIDDNPVRMCACCLQKRPINTQKRPIKIRQYR